MGVLGRLVEENVLDDQAFQISQRCLDVLRIGIRLGDVLALDVHSLKSSRDSRIKHVRNPVPRLGVELRIPQGIEMFANRGIADRSISRQLMRIRPHVTRPLHIVLAAQRIDADTAPPNIPSRHRQIGDPHHRGRALAVLSNPQAIVNRTVGSTGIEPSRSANQFGGNAGHFGHRLRTVFRTQNEFSPRLKGGLFTTGPDKLFVDQPLADHRMRQGVDHGHIGAWPQLQMVGCGHMRGPHQVDRPRVNHD